MRYLYHRDLTSKPESRSLLWGIKNGVIKGVYERAVDAGRHLDDSGSL
jgi:hypothetical protein